MYAKVLGAAGRLFTRTPQRCNITIVLVFRGVTEWNYGTSSCTHRHPLYMYDPERLSFALRPAPVFVQDLADLLETCCEDVGKACGATDPFPFLSSGEHGEHGEHRLNRLLRLWGDSRSRVRACAVRSLLSLAQGIVG